jgi:SAM-dependent methyltransferase
LVDFSTTTRLADVGCGNSIYIERVADRLAPGATVIGVDLSVGMLGEARHQSGRVAADVQSLPIATGSLDALLALHMLYHVPDIPKGVRELRRVVHEGGMVVVATNGAGHLAELAAVAGLPPFGSMSPLDLDRAEALLGEEFAEVVRHDLPSTLEVPEPEPVIAYLRSLISLGFDAEKLDAAAERVAATIDDEGVFRISMQPGLLVCR